MPATLAHLLADAGFGESLTAQHLPAFLSRQRWYTSKAKTIADLDVTPLPSQSTDMGLWLVRIVFADDTDELRVLAVAEVDRPFAPDDPRVIARTDAGALIDAVGEEGFRESLYALMAGDVQLQTDTGTLTGVAGKTCREQPEYVGSNVPPQNSSNTVITYQPEGFFKLFRKTEAGLHPDAELLEYLSKERHFASVPTFGGALGFTPVGSDEPITLGLMLGKVDHRGEAWETMLHDVAAYAKTFRESETLQTLRISGDLTNPLRREHLPAELMGAMGQDTIRRIELLGQRTAEMHLHFAAGKREAIAPQPLTRDYWASAKTALAKRVGEEARYAQDVLKGSLTSIESWLNDTALPVLDAGCIRVHGDYHLGQVLDTADDVVIIDFEGEPLHSLSYRRRRHPAFKDVAGMTRSLHYAPYAHALQEADGADWALASAKTWYHVAARLFLTRYFDTVGDAPFVPSDPGDRDALLAFFLVDKALYELAYERSSRPGWIRIPEAGVNAAAAMLAGVARTSVASKAA